MSLLDKATIITTPTAHSNGKLHSIKGGEVADFDVVRGSAATRVNAEGLIENISIIGDNLATNGDFSSDLSGWSSVSNVVWSSNFGGSAFFNGIDSQFRQSESYVVGKTYIISWEVKENNGCNLFRVYNNNSFTNITDNYVGVHSIEFTQTAGALLIFRNGTTGSDITIDNISVKEIIDATNIPRIDYTTGEGLILTEPQSTNLITYSEDFSDSYWGTYGSEVSRTLDNSQANPSGSNGSYIVEGVNGLRRFGTIVPVTPSTDYTISFYVKNINATTLRILMTNSSISSQNFISQVNTTDWSRVEINFTSGTGTSTTIQFLRDLPIGESLYIWGAQVEEKSHSTSYIPTSGAIATRLADKVTGAGDANTFNDSEGVLYAEIASLSEDDTAARYLGISNGTSANRVVILYYSATNKIRAIMSSGGTTVADINTTVTSVEDFHKVAVKYKTNDFAFWVDGVEVAIDTTAATPIGLDRLAFNLANGSHFYGKTKTIAVFSEALTDEELTCLTTI